MLHPWPDAVDPAMDISAHQLMRAVVDTGAAQVMLMLNSYLDRRGARRRSHCGGYWLGHRRGVDTDRVDGARPGRAGCP